MYHWAMIVNHLWDARNRVLKSLEGRPILSYIFLGKLYPLVMADIAIENGHL